MTLWGWLGASLANAVFRSGKASGRPAERKRSANSKLTYSGHGPAGEIQYAEGPHRFRMYYEFGGGNVLAIISVPAAEGWVAATGIPIARRDEVLREIAAQVVSDQTSTGRNRVEIGADRITIFE
ncbi:MAG: hypothetical protein AB7L66_10695 [Gemmatimonadales bacterium]